MEFDFTQILPKGEIFKRMDEKNALLIKAKKDVKYQAISDELKDLSIDIMDFKSVFTRTI